VKVDRLDFITIFVKDMPGAMKFFGEIFETDFTETWSTEMDTRETIDSAGLNLVTPLTPDGVSAQAMAKRGEGLVSVGFKVPDLDKAIAELNSRGVRLLQREKIGTADAATFHPKDAYGVMLILVEYKEKDAGTAFTAK